MAAQVTFTDFEVHINACIFLYGTHADDFLAKKIEDEINRMWNHPLVIFKRDNRDFKVIFKIDCRVLSLEKVKKMMQSNVSYACNFVRVEEKNGVERSMMGYGLGQNSGHWLVTDNLGDSTTAAHEFGHALGLPHPDRADYRFTGYPPIMAPRGTLVDAEFQWNPLADIGAVGGTMNPKYRRVRQEEVLTVLKGIVAKEGNIFIIGEISNLYFNEKGEPQHLEKLQKPF